MCNLSTGIYNKGKQEGRREGGLEMLFRLVKENLITAAAAAQQANMEQSVFEKKYRAYLQ